MLFIEKLTKCSYSLFLKNTINGTKPNIKGRQNSGEFVLLGQIMQWKNLNAEYVRASHAEWLQDITILLNDEILDSLIELVQNTKSGIDN